MTMTTDAEKPAAHIELIFATPEQQPILANLLELYIHDFSEFHDVELEPDGGSATRTCRSSGSSLIGIRSRSG